MNTVLIIFYYLFIISSVIAMIFFWVSMISKKGSKMHIKGGGLFVNSGFVLAISMLIIGISAFFKLGNPVSRIIIYNSNSQSVSFDFLLILVPFLIITSIYLGKWTLIEKRKPIKTKSKLYLSILAVTAILSLMIFYLGITANNIVYIIFTLIGLYTVYTSFKFTKISNPNRKDYFHAHLGSMIGAGASIYSLFGGSIFINSILPRIKTNIFYMDMIYSLYIPLIIGFIMTYVSKSIYTKKMKLDSAK